VQTIDRVEKGTVPHIFIISTIQISRGHIIATLNLQLIQLFSSWL